MTIIELYFTILIGISLIIGLHNTFYIVRYLRFDNGKNTFKNSKISSNLEDDKNDDN